MLVNIEMDSWIAMAKGQHNSQMLGIFSLKARNWCESLNRT